MCMNRLTWRISFHSVFGPYGFFAPQNGFYASVPDMASQSSPEIQNLRLPSEGARNALGQDLQVARVHISIEKCRFKCGVSEF